MISAALKGELDDVAYDTLPIFDLKFPKTCPGVPSEIMNPRDTWDDKNAYDVKIDGLVAAFNKNFEMYESNVSEEILAAAPKPEPA